MTVRPLLRPSVWIVVLGLGAIAADLSPAVRAQQAFGTGRISGVVVSSDAPPRPVRRAIVTLAGAGANGRSAITGDDGRFVFEGLPAGRFSLTASKPSYIRNAFGARSPGRPGTAVSLAAGQAVDGLTIVLPHGAAITGTVRDHTGEPASAVQVFVLRADAPSPEPVPARQDAVLTDDRGTYRAYGLAPGAYLVAASPVQLGAGEMTVRSATEVDELIRQQLQQPRLGPAAPRSSANTAAAAPAAAIPLAPPRTQGYTYAPIFYPGTPNATEAEHITVKAGEERSGIDITLDLVPIGTIEGVAVNPSGVVPELTLSISNGAPALPGVFAASPQISGRPGSKGDPSFKFTSVWPGHYTITARTSKTRTIYLDNGFRTEAVEPGSVPDLWAIAEVDVGPQGLTGLTLELQPAMTFSGRIAFDATTLKPPEDLASLRVTVSTATSNAGPTPMLVNGSLVGQQPITGSATVRADGTFVVTGLMPGRYTITCLVPGMSGPNGWWLQSAVVGGRDALDSLLTMGSAGSAAGAVLTFSDRHAELGGTLRAPAGQPATEFYVIAFPAEKDLWRPGSRRVRAVRPASDGVYSFPDLPPGNYILAALSDVAADEWQNPSFLEQIAGAGVKVTVAPGEKKVQSLQISGG